MQHTLKIKTPGAKRPELGRGQLWRYEDGEVYLAVTTGESKPTLVSLMTFNYWSDKGFDGDEDRFTYIGTMKTEIE